MIITKKEVVIMKKKVETLKENEEYVKAYDDSKFEKPSVTADIVICFADPGVLPLYEKIKSSFNPERNGTI